MTIETFETQLVEFLRPSVLAAAIVEEEECDDSLENQVLAALWRALQASAGEDGAIEMVRYARADRK